MARLRDGRLGCFARMFVLVAVMMAGTVGVAHAGESDQPGDAHAPVPLLGDNPLGTLVKSPPDRATTSIVAVEGQPFDHAIRLETLIVPASSFHIQLSARTKEAIREGDSLMLTFSLRGVETDQPDGRYTVAWVWEERGQSNNRKMTPIVRLENLSADGEWTHFEERLVAPFDLEVEQSQIAFRFGFHMQTVELGGLQLWKLSN